MPIRSLLTLISLIALAFWPGERVQAQERPVTTTPPAKAEQEATPLEKIPIPTDAILVICENLGQAVQQMQPGSIILSPKRYQALIEELAKLKSTAATEEERLFSACRIQGQWLPAQPPFSLQDEVELTFELEFQTEAPLTRWPLPLKGLRLTFAELDGQSPIWSRSPQGLVLTVPEAKQHRLMLRGRVPVTRVGANRKWLLERLPSAAITSFQFTTIEDVVEASIKGAGPVRIEPTQGKEKIVLAKALGVVQQLEFQWQIRTPADDQAAAVQVQGDLRFAVDESSVETEARLRFDLPSGKINHLRLKLPPNVDNLRIDAWQREDQRTVLEWSGPDPQGEVTVRLPSAWLADEAAHTLRLRFSQLHEAKVGETLHLGQIVVADPPCEKQTGVITLASAPELHYRVDPGPLRRSDVHVASWFDARGFAQSFRYLQQPAQIKATLERIEQPMLAAEARLSYQLRLVPGQLKLTCQLEIHRRSSFGLDQIEMSWPKGWNLNSELFLSPLVRQAQQDATTDTLRLSLVGRLPDVIKLTLEGDWQTSGASRTNLRLPRLLSGWGERDQRRLPVQWVTSAAPLIIEGSEHDIRLETGSQALLAESQTPLELDTWMRPPFRVQVRSLAMNQGEGAQTAPQLQLQWKPRQPVLRSEAQVFITPTLPWVRQQWHWQWPGQTPAQMQLYVPTNILASLRLAWQTPSDAALRPISWTVMPGGGEGATLITIRPPGPGVEAATLWCEFPLPHRGPPAHPSEDQLIELRWVVPRLETDEEKPTIAVLVWLDARFAAQWHATAAARKMADAALPQRTRMGWSVMPRLEATFADATLPVSIQLTPDKESAHPTTVERILMEARPLQEGWTSLRASLWVQRLTHEEMTLAIPWPATSLVLERIAVMGQPLQERDVRLEAQEERTRLHLRLAPTLLSQSFYVEIFYQVRDAAPSWLIKRWSLPAVELASAAAPAQTRWRVEWPRSQSLLLSEAARLEQGPSWNGFWREPQPSYLKRAMDAWFMPTGGGSNVQEGASENAALSFSTSAARMTLWHVSRLAWQVLCSTFVLLLGYVVWRMRSLSRWTTLGCIFLGLLLMVFMTPELAFQMGCAAQPGLLVIAFILLAGWSYQGMVSRRIQSRFASSQALLPSTLMVKPSTSQERAAASSSTSSVGGS